MNVKTRNAFREAETGLFAGKGDSVLRYLLKLATDSDQTVAVRVQAAKVALPYLKPALSAVEQTNTEPAMTLSEDDILKQITDLLKARPDLINQAQATIARESVSPVSDVKAGTG